METLVYLLFALGALVGPGIALQRLAGVRVDPSLVVSLGTAATAFCYWVSLVSGVSWVFPGMLGLLGIGLLWRGWNGSATGPSFRGALGPVACFLALLAITQFPWNRRGPDGDFLLDPLVP